MSLLNNNVADISQSTMPCFFCRSIDVIEGVEFENFEGVFCKTLVCENIVVRASEGDGIGAVVCTDKEGNGKLYLMSNGFPHIVAQYENGNPRISIFSEDHTEKVAVTMGSNVGGAVIVHKEGELDGKIFTCEGVQNTSEFNS